MQNSLFSRILGFIEKALMILAGFMLVLMLISMSVDASGRYLFNRPLPGNFEFTAFFSMVMLTYLALPRTYVIGGHVRLEILEERLRKVPFHLSQRLNTLLAGIVFGLITWYAGGEAIAKIEARETTIGLVQLPIYLSFTSFPLGCGILTLRLLIETISPAPHKQDVEIEL